MKVSAFMKILEGLHHLMGKKGNCWKTELFLALNEDFFKILIEFFHDDVGVLIEFFESVDPWEVREGIELNKDIKLFLDEYGFLHVQWITLPWFFSILHA
jgi:hypothetical protein